MTCSFFTIHYPRYQNSPSPEITAIADGKGATLNHKWGTDTILMANETFIYNGGGINFTGKVAVLRNMNGESWLTLVEGTQLGYNGQNLDGPGIIHLP